MLWDSKRFRRVLENILRHESNMCYESNSFTKWTEEILESTTLLFRGSTSLSRKYKEKFYRLSRKSNAHPNYHLMLEHFNSSDIDYWKGYRTHHHELKS